MRVIASALIIGCASVQSVLATVCPTTAYNGAEFYQNLVVGAVIEVASLADMSITTKTASEAKNAFYAATIGMDSTSTPHANAYLSAHLSDSGGCAACAYTFFTGVVDKLKAIRFSGSPQDNTAAVAFPCGGPQNLKNAATFNYGHTNGGTLAWSAIPDNSISMLTDYDCGSFFWTR